MTAELEKGKQTVKMASPAATYRSSLLSNGDLHGSEIFISLVTAIVPLLAPNAKQSTP